MAIEDQVQTLVDLVNELVALATAKNSQFDQIISDADARIATALIPLDEANVSKDAAEAAAVTASAAATDATNAKTAIETIQANVSSIQSTVTTLRDDTLLAKTSVDTALASANTALQSALDAAQSATTSKDAAASSATSALDSATLANTHKDAASASAVSAAEEALAALSSKTAAASSDAAAAISKAAAAVSAAAALTSETAAAEAKDLAEAAATTATGAKDTSIDLAASASASETNAATSATTAATAKDEAVAAKDAAVVAKDEAVAASATVDGVVTAASESAASALTAKQAAETAETNAVAAQTSATSSASASESAAAAAALSEQNAATSAADALTHKNDAATSAASAATSASTAQNAVTEATNAKDAAVTASESVDGVVAAAEGHAADAQTSATAASTAETNAVAAKSAAEAASTIASDKAAEATTSATTAADHVAGALSHKNAAQTAASSASTSESNASTHATTASNSAATAVSARDATLAALDNFDDRYLGSFADEPTTDNDGNALSMGALFFDETVSGMKVYDANSTQWKLAYSSLDGALLSDNNLSDLTNVPSARDNLDLGESSDVTFGSITASSINAPIGTESVRSSGALMDDELSSVTSVKSINQNLTTASSPSFVAVTANLNGTATSAIALSTARTVTFTGGVTGSLTFDGSADVSANLTLSAHTHEIADVNGLQAALDSAGTAEHSHVIADVTGLQTALDDKAAAAHTHTTSEVTGLDTALAGKAAVSHSHATSDVTGLDTALSGKSDVGHGHAISEVAGLQTLLDDKATVSHGHTTAEVTGLDTALDGKAPAVHAHEISDVNGLQDALDSAGTAEHTHAISEVTGLQAELDGKSAVGHTHAISDTTGLQTALDGKSDVGHGHTVSDISDITDLFNNGGQPFQTYTRFDEVDRPGVAHIYGNSDAPHTDSIRWYSITINIGTDKTFGRFMTQLAWPRHDCSSNNTFYTRIMESEKWRDWYPVDARRAEQLKTARNIVLSGEVTGSVSFDGTQDVSIDTTISGYTHSHIIADVTDLQTVLDGKADTTLVALTPTSFGALEGRENAYVTTQAFNACADEARATGRPIQLPAGNWFVSDTIDFSGCTVRGAGIGLWLHLPVYYGSEVNLPANTQIILTGSAFTPKHLYGITSMKSCGAQRIKTIPRTNINETEFNLTSFMNADATTGEATPKDLRVGILVGGTSPAHLEGFRVLPDGGGDDGLQNYNDETYNNLCGSIDIGIMQIGSKACVFEDLQIVGHYREVGYLNAAKPLEADFEGYISPYETTLSRCSIEGHRAVAIRAPDKFKILDSTDTSVDLPWANDHPFTTAGTGNNVFRLSTVGTGTSGGATFYYTTVEKIAVNGEDRVRLSGFTGLAAAIGTWDAVVTATTGGTNSHIEFKECQFGGLIQPDGYLPNDSVNAGSPTTNGAIGGVEISGWRSCETRLDACRIQHSGTIGVYIHENREVVLDLMVESNNARGVSKHGLTHIISPQSGANTHHEHAIGGARWVDFRYAINSENSTSGIDMHPHALYRPRPELFSEEGDGWCNPYWGLEHVVQRTYTDADGNHKHATGVHALKVGPEAQGYNSPALKGNAHIREVSGRSELYVETTDADDAAIYLETPSGLWKMFRDHSSGGDFVLAMSNDGGGTWTTKLKHENGSTDTGLRTAVRKSTTVAAG